jgi:hypothetical protein
VYHNPAVLSNGTVWVAPIPISRKEAIAIMMLDNEFIGVCLHFLINMHEGYVAVSVELEDLKNMVLKVAIGIISTGIDIQMQIVGILAINKKESINC